MFSRTIFDHISSHLFANKTIILYGARQVGKTTLTKTLLAAYPEDSLFLDCEILYNKELLAEPDDIKLRTAFGDKKLLIIDEAQYIPQIGPVLKILHDHIPSLQVIATGSSSFELAHHAHQSLAGRAISYTLYPISVAELLTTYEPHQFLSLLPRLLQYGSYPDILNHDATTSREYLGSIVNNYLYRDILEFGGVRKPAILIKLLQLLALQVGSEVSYGELANHLEVSRQTVEQYIDLLEKCFVIFKLTALSRNLRNEISKSFKVYFRDIGVLNSIINNFNGLDLRSDKGGLRENFCIAERRKYLSNNRINANTYFWRTQAQQEIDYIEERDGRFSAYECKVNPKARTKYTSFKKFATAYDCDELTVLTPETILPFVT